MSASHQTVRLARGRHPSARWPARLGGRDPAAAVEETLGGLDSSPTRVG